MQHFNKSVFLINADCVKTYYSQPWNKRYDYMRGTGFCISIGGKLYILTAYHVIEDARIITIEFAHEAKLVFGSKILDLALLTCDFEATPLYIGTMLPGDEVMALGYPLMSDILSITRGVSSKLAKYDCGLVSILAYHTDTPINSGNSGGPLVNMHGQYVGVMVSTYIGVQNMNVAIPFFTIRFFIESFEAGQLQFMIPTFKWQYADDYMGIEDSLLINGKHAVSDIEGIKITREGNICFGDFLQYYGFTVEDDQEIPFYYLLAHIRKNTVQMGKYKLKLQAESFDMGEPEYLIFGDFIFAPANRGLMSEIQKNIAFKNGHPRAIIIVSLNKRYWKKVLDIEYDELRDKLKKLQKTLVVPFYGKDWILHLNPGDKKNDKLKSLFK